MTTQTLKIDGQFSKLWPRLQGDEFDALRESIAEEGCREPLVVWEETGILLDGHNRYEICRELEVDFDLVELSFDEREDAADWIDRNQLGRRNLTKEQFALGIGRRYERAKKSEGAPQGNQNAEKQRGQNEPVVSSSERTSEKIAKEHGVSPATVKRSGKYAAAVEKLGDDLVYDEDGQPRASRSAIIEAASVYDDDSEAAERILAGEPEPESAEPDVVTDDDGHTVPDDLLPVFDDERDDLDEIIREAKSIRRRLTSLEKQRLMAWNRPGSGARAQADLLVKQLEHVRPAIVCRACGGTNSSGCKPCHGRGFICEQQARVHRQHHGGRA